MNAIVENEGKEIQVSTPSDMIIWAMQNGSTVEQLEKLMELKERHEANEARKAFVKAMAAFRNSQTPIAKTRKGHNCMYAGLAETIEQITPLLASNGLSHRWETKQEDGKITVKCFLTHVDGHSECAEMVSGADTSGSKNNIQAIGSAISYLQRYTLFSVCGLASREVDDDGAAAGRKPVLFDVDAALKEVSECNNLDDLSKLWQRQGAKATEAKDRVGYTTLKDAVGIRKEELKNV